MVLGGSRLRSRWLRTAMVASVILMILVAPAGASDNLVEGEKAIVAGTNGSGVNVRSEPGTSSDVYFVAEEGTIVDVTSGLHEADGFTWVGVRIDGQDAWIMSEFVGGIASQAGDQVRVVKTDGHGLRLRADAASESETLTVLPEGTVLDVIGDEVPGEVSWVNVNYSGTEGFLHNGYTAVVSLGNHDAGSGVSNEPESPASDNTSQDSDQSHDSDAVHEEPEPEPGPDPEPEPPASDEASQDSDHADGSDAVHEEPEPGPEPEPEPTDPNGVHVGGNAEIVNTSGYGLNVRHGAGYGHGVVTVANGGSVVQVLDGPEVDGEGSNWWNVDYQGLSGWVHGEYLAATDADPTGAGSGSGQSNPDEDSGNGSDPPASSSIGDQIANEALNYLGYPYAWGGTTPAGFDCSGFLYHVVNQVNGGNFPRLLDAQVNRGTYVPSDQLQPGDLVFQQNTYMWGLSHAGVYIGNGQFIHASTPGSGVVISNLWDSYWGQRYYTARRIS